MPTPNPDESKDDFIERCMSDDEMQEKHADNDERFAVCNAFWEDRSGLPAREVRILAPEDVELRVHRDKDGKPTRIAGYAARFNKNSEVLGDRGFQFVERIRPGAFKNALKTSDVRALFNHDPNLILGRRQPGKANTTLRMIENARGLKFEVDVPNTQAARDIAESIDREDVTGCSFCFAARPETVVWSAGEEGAPDVRELTEVDPLFDIGPVTYPAYPDTSVAVRSLDAWRKKTGREDRQADIPTADTTESQESNGTSGSPEDTPEPEQREATPAEVLAEMKAEHEREETEKLRNGDNFKRTQADLRKKMDKQ